MRLIRYGLPGAERPGMLDAQGILRDLSMLLPDIGPAQLAPRTLAALAAIDATTCLRCKSRCAWRAPWRAWARSCAWA